jgi:hypothetical protein
MFTNQKSFRSVIKIDLLKQNGELLDVYKRFIPNFHSIQEFAPSTFTPIQPRNSL